TRTRSTTGRSSYWTVRRASSRVAPRRGGPRMRRRAIFCIGRAGRWRAKKIFIRGFLSIVEFFFSAGASRFSAPGPFLEGFGPWGWSGLAAGHRRRRLGLDHHEHAAMLGVVGAFAV